MNGPSRPGPAGKPLSLQWLGPAVVAISFVATAALTWRKWPDPLIDFGFQLVLPWKISTGSVLYRDVAYLPGGPLSQYFDALLFKLFGVSLLTLVISNLTIAAGLLVLIYRRFLAASDAWTATTICLGIVLVFAFGQYSSIGNYNFITPYSHEVWHGVVLAIVSIALLSSWVAKERLGYALGAGFCGGLVFMTKAEVFVALMAAAAGAFILFARTKGRVPFVLKSLSACLLAGVVPLIIFVLYFRRVEDWQASFRSVVFAWVPLLETRVSKDVFYQWCLGLDTPGFHIRAMLIHFFTVSAVVIVSVVLFRRRLDKSTNRLLAAAWIALLLALASGFDWADCGRSLPLLGLVLCVILCTKYRPLSAEAPPVFPLLWSIFGLVLLAKLGLYSRIWHYGFALAMPAFVGAVYLLLWLLPRLLEKHGVHRRLFRSAVWLVLMAGFAQLFLQSQFVYQRKTTVVGRGGDKILVFNEKVNPAGAAIQSALAWMEKNAPPDATLAVLPEGAMVNYLSRRTNPTHYLVWDPAEMTAYGQDNMTADFKSNRPDYVMLIHRDEGEYGANYFGKEQKFGLELMRWIQKNYEPVCLIGSEPLQNASFGIKILKRISTVK